MIEYDEAWNNRHDPQRQTPAGFCKRCGGEIFEIDTLEAYDGVCPACWWAENGDSGTGDPSPAEDGRTDCHSPVPGPRNDGDGGTDSSAPLCSAQNDGDVGTDSSAPLRSAQNDGDGGDGG